MTTTKETTMTRRHALAAAAALALVPPPPPPPQEALAAIAEALQQLSTADLYRLDFVVDGLWRERDSANVPNAMTTHEALAGGILAPRRVDGVLWHVRPERLAGTPPRHRDADWNRELDAAELAA